MTTASALRPNLDIVAATSRTGGTTYDYQALADADKTTYVTHAGSYYAKVGLTSFTLPAGAVTKSLTIRAQARYENFDDYGYGVAVRKSPGSDTGEEICRLEVGETTSTFVVSTSAAQPVSLTSDSIALMQLWYSHYGSSDSTEFAAFYVDLVYVTQPVVTVTAVSPDPWTASTVPTIEWTNSRDLDGGVQKRYHVKVFDEATYGVGFTGLDPETDTPFYDSGELTGSKNSRRVGPLLNGDAYRAYVKTAQIVNGNKLWSEWAYDEFDVSVTTTDVDTVTTAATNASGLVTVTVARDALSSAWDLIEVQRSLDAGVTWADVRLATYVDCTADADEFVVIDYEIPNGTSSLHRARATRIVATYPVTGAWVQSTPSVAWTSTDTWLKVPEAPANNLTATLRHAVTSRRPVRRGVFEILGSSLPVVVSDTRNGSNSDVITLRATTLAATQAILDVVDAYDVVLIQTPTDQLFGSKYVSVGDVTVVPVLDQVVGPYHWIELADVIEVASPPDPTAGELYWDI